MLGKGWSSSEVILADQFGLFSMPIISQIWPEGAKKWGNRLKIEVWPHKLAKITNIWFEGLEQY